MPTMKYFCDVKQGLDLKSDNWPVWPQTNLFAKAIHVDSISHRLEALLKPIYISSVGCSVKYIG